MDFSGLDLNLLVALDALLAERSVSRAGERLHLSQSATSGALARLREAFRDPLLVVVGRAMTLTPLAESLIEPIRVFLLQAEFILHQSPVFNPAKSTRRFRVMMSDYVETVIMSEALPRIQRLAPGVTFELFSNDNSRGIERGEIDLSITPSRYLAQGHPAEHLFGFQPRQHVVEHDQVEAGGSGEGRFHHHRIGHDVDHEVAIGQCRLDDSAGVRCLLYTSPSPRD